MKPEGQRVKQEAGKLRTQAAQGESPAKGEGLDHPLHPRHPPPQHPIPHTHTPSLADFPSTAQELAAVN